jgi:hypothetical protein
MQNAILEFNQVSEKMAMDREVDKRADVSELLLTYSL